MESEVITVRVRPYGTKKKLQYKAKKLGFKSLNEYLETLLINQLKK